MEKFDDMLKSKEREREAAARKLQDIGTMEIDLEDMNPPTAFAFGGAKVFIRLATGEDWEKIEKATTESHVEYKNGVRYSWVDTPENRPELKRLRNEMMWDFCVVSWDGLINKKTGEPIPCTSENKMMLMNRSTAFASFFADCIKTLSEESEKRAEELRKNGKTS